LLNLHLFVSENTRFVQTSKVLASIGAAAFDTEKIAGGHDDVHKTFKAEVGKSAIVQENTNMHWPEKSLVSKGMIEEILTKGRKD